MRGLFEALVARDHGRRDPLHEWVDRAHPRLVRDLGRWRRLPDGPASELADRLVEEAFLAVVRGETVRDELAWMAGVARNLLLREARERGRRPLSGLRLDALPARKESEGPEDRDERQARRRRLAAAIRSLPAPFREALDLHYRRGWTVRRVAAYLRGWGGIGDDASRRILKEGRRMLLAAARGIDPRGRWPTRYSRRNARFDTPPPPAE